MNNSFGCSNNNAPARRGKTIAQPPLLVYTGRKHSFNPAPPPAPRPYAAGDHVHCNGLFRHPINSLRPPSQLKRNSNPKTKQQKVLGLRPIFSQYQSIHTKTKDYPCN